MRKDYHIHANVMNQPEQFDAFVARAMSQHIAEICVTDHMPLTISHASDRIPAGCVRDYADRVRELAKRYEDRITIRCGIEIDYHPLIVDEIRRVLDAGRFDFVLGSSHLHLFLFEFSRYTQNDFARMSVENSIRAAETGLFSAISHPDMYRNVFERRDRYPIPGGGYDFASVRDLFDHLIDEVRSRDMAMEINAHLAEAHDDLRFTYPQEEIVICALQKSVRFAYGSDAHRPQSVGACLDALENHEIYGKALNIWEAAE